MDGQVSEKFNSYPSDIRKKLLCIRSLIYQLGREYAVGHITESLKWGVPSYAALPGSPVRLDWVPERSETYAVYFNCNTKLIETFREIYTSRFDYDGNRAIRLPRHSAVPVADLSPCLSMALRYKSLRKLPLLGA